MSGPGFEFVKKTADEAVRAAYNKFISDTDKISQNNWFVGKVSNDRNTILHPNGTNYNLSLGGIVEDYDFAFIINSGSVDPVTGKPILGNAYAPGKPFKKTEVVKAGTAYVLFSDNISKVFIQCVKNDDLYEVPLQSGFTTGNISFGKFTPSGKHFVLGYQDTTFNNLIIHWAIYKNWSLITDDFGNKVVKADITTDLATINDGYLGISYPTPIDPSSGFSSTSVSNGSSSIPFVSFEDPCAGPVGGSGTDDFTATMTWTDYTPTILGDSDLVNCVVGAGWDAGSNTDKVATFLGNFVLSEDDSKEPVLDFIGSFTLQALKYFISALDDLDSTEISSTNGQGCCHGVPILKVISGVQTSSVVVTSRDFVNCTTQILGSSHHITQDFEEPDGPECNGGPFQLFCFNHSPTPFGGDNGRCPTGSFAVDSTTTASSTITGWLSSFSDFSTNPETNPTNIYLNKIQSDLTNYGIFSIENLTTIVSINSSSLATRGTNRGWVPDIRAHGIITSSGVKVQDTNVITGAEYHFNGTRQYGFKTSALVSNALWDRDHDASYTSGYINVPGTTESLSFGDVIFTDTHYFDPRPASLTASGSLKYYKPLKSETASVLGVDLVDAGATNVVNYVYKLQDGTFDYYKTKSVKGKKPVYTSNIFDWTTKG